MTDNDGRAAAFLTSDQFVSGYYKMRFGVGGYFASKGMDTFFPFAEVVFEVMVARWLKPDFKIACVWPFGLLDYGSATLRCKI